MNQLKKFRTWTKKTTEWYQEVDRIIKGIPKLLLYIIYGSSMFFGVITTIWSAITDVFPIFLIGVLMTVSPPIIHLREWIIAIFSLFWGEMVRPFFLWILWIRTQGFSVFLTREYGIQLSAVILTCLALYKLQTYRMLPYVLFALLIIAAFFLSGGETEMTSTEWSNFVSGGISLLLLILVTIIPGFFVGFLTGNEEKGKNSVGLGSFLAAWVGLVRWAPEIFSSLRTDAWGIFAMVLILIGMTILLFILCGIGMLCGYAGEHVGIKVRRNILKKFGII